MLKVVYPGTFDPFTRGHEDLVRRAARLFETVIVGVADSERKGPLFTAPERIAMAAEVLAGYPNVKVMGFSGLLMNFVHSVGANVIVRGLRAVSDFEYEFQLANMNRRLYPDFDSVFVMTGEDYFYVSARLVREVARFGGDVSSLVPPNVLAALQAKRTPGTFGR
jgi:pantetheine-phosphate adenylyltransferase